MIRPVERFPVCIDGPRRHGLQRRRRRMHGGALAAMLPGTLLLLAAVFLARAAMPQPTSWSPGAVDLFLSAMVAGLIWLVAMPRRTALLAAILAGLLASGGLAVERYQLLPPDVNSVRATVTALADWLLGGAGPATAQELAATSRVRLTINGVPVVLRVAPDSPRTVLSPVDMLRTGLPVKAGGHVSIPQLQLAGRSLTDVDAVIAADARAPSVLGRDVLDRLVGEIEPAAR